jgi:hypothetical protein
MILFLALFLLTNPAWAEGVLTYVGPDRVPLVIVQGNAYEMGHSVGKLMTEDINKLLAGVLQRVQQADPNHYSHENLDRAWQTVQPYLSQQWKAQLQGLADGSGLPHQLIIRVHMIPVLGNYSCSGAALWGKATADNKMYIFRNLDYMLNMRMQDFPLIVVCLPEDGLPHVSPTFAGFLGVQTGMNAKGLALTEMGDSPATDYPFDLDGIPFIALFSDLLYRTENLLQALDTIQQAKRIKKYHYVIGSATDNQGIKIKAHNQNLEIWRDNDPNDEYAPDHIFKKIVINAETRAPIAFEHIRTHYGKYSIDSVIDLTRSIPIKGGNLLGVVYNATDLKMYFAYAKDKLEAYQQDFTCIDLNDCFDYKKSQTKFKIIKTTAGE